MKLEFITSKRTQKRLPVLIMTIEEYNGERAEDAGLCLSCGAAAYGVEPDARNYTCEACEEPSVFGIEEAQQMGRIRFADHEEGDA
jgi:hypothetical protein